jgi:hypothetical protein
MKIALFFWIYQNKAFLAIKYQLIESNITNTYSINPKLHVPNYK